MRLVVPSSDYIYSVYDRHVYEVLVYSLVSTNGSAFALPRVSERKPEMSSGAMP